MLIENHPKMVARWIQRCTEIKERDGAEAAKQWASKMFSPQQIRIINETLRSKTA